MSARGHAGLIPLIGLLCGCGAHSGWPAPGARADFMDAKGARVGSAVLFEGSDGLKIRTDLHGLPPGDHGLHVHATGSCVAPFQTAGGHFNPLGKKHGSMNPDGSHAGDLANLPVQSNGTAHVEILATGLHLTTLFDGDGSALVIHAAPDDYKTDPSGNSGARIACAVIRKP